MSRIKYQVTDSRGRVHTRTTDHRVYTHCVVAHIGPRPATKFFAASPGASFAEWAGRLDLAENVKRRWERSHRQGGALEGVEILVAERVS